MKLFSCQHCGQMLYFENTKCERCDHALGYLPDINALSALEADGAAFQPLAQPQKTVRFCENVQHGVCNWMVAAESEDRFCAACRHNRVIPDLSVPENQLRWQKLEDAKHRLFYTMLRLNLPLQDRIEDPDHGLVFDFLAESPDPTGPKVMTGHDNGVITIALIEADDAERERRRSQMHEPYRTLLGHFRHEVGHHFWDLMVRDGGWLEEFRQIFGDDTLDYGQALTDHYNNGAPPDWQTNFVSSYASTHPWEDWAETWAHYLHIVDTLEMASAFGLRVHPQGVKAGEMNAKIDFDPHLVDDVQTLIDAWLPLSFAMNSLNRAMGQNDIYPFILSPQVIGKLGFVHKVVHGQRGVQTNAESPAAAVQSAA